MIRIFEFSLILRNFLALVLLHIPIKAIIPGAAHSPPVIEVLLNFLSFNPAIVFAIFLSEIDTQHHWHFLIFAMAPKTSHYTTFHP